MLVKGDTGDHGVTAVANKLSSVSGVQLTWPQDTSFAHVLLVVPE